MAIFLTLFVMVILQSCEKETVEVTEPEQEHKDEVVTIGESLERESGYNWIHKIKKLDQRYGLIAFPGGNMIYDRYTNFAYFELKKNYNITDVYIINTDKEYADIRMTSEDYVVIPINLNAGYENPNPWISKKANNIFLALRVRAYNENVDIVVNFNILTYPVQQTPPVGSEWNNCTNISLDYSGMQIHGYFNEKLGNLNHGTDGHYVYLQVEKTFLRHDNQSIAIKGVALAHSDYKWAAVSQLNARGYYRSWINLNYRNSSRQKIYLGWKR
jgi:hypothetical protein